VIPHAFGRGDPWTVGIEEELWVVDPATLEPTPPPAEVFDGVRRKAELFAAVLELNTGVSRTVAEAGDELRALREDAKRRVGEAGLALAASGTWPPAAAEGHAITPQDGYLRFVEYAGPSARRQFCSGVHVHIAVESPDASIRRLESVLPWLPVLLAVSANSPFLAAEETGLASTRAELLALLPRSGAPPLFAEYAEWERFAERLVELGLADEWSRIWWDARPHPRFGTLEIRMPDQPTRVEISVAFAALVQALVASAEPGAPGDRGVYAQNRWAALRFGAQAELIHPDGERLAPAPRLLEELVERIHPTAERLGSADLLVPLEGLAQADEQLAIARREGMRPLCEHLIGLT
jgi:glutamate---cysteine ligase / carboxylate-amine ligase